LIVCGCSCLFQLLVQHYLQVPPLLCSIVCCYCWCAAAASFVGTALVVAALQHLFATAGAVLWTAAAAVGTELEDDGAAALFALCLYSLVWYLASASAKVRVFGIS
jgi:hypothetical protein